MFIDLSRPIWAPSLSSCSILPLYVKSPSYSGVGPDELTVGAHSYADFMTYFGSFSMKKWRLYTGDNDLVPTLVLETNAPVHVTLTQMVYRRLEKRTIMDVTDPTSLTPDGWFRYAIPYPADVDAQLVSFTVTTGDRPATLRAVCYGADVKHRRDVRIEIITTTFRKERQVQGNIDLIRTTLLEDPCWGEYFHLTVVDNGRSLPEDAAAGNPSITVIPNGNVGGAGGFAAGMIHAAEQKWATHVLLMDDDVTVCPESFKRTLRLLECASAEYESATVAGAMLSTANFELQQEDIGQIQAQRHLQPFKPRLIMDREYDITFNEELIPSSQEQGLYSAWWYSCFPVRRIHENGLPIPLFYRRDDVEYSTRIQEKEQLKFITLNGVCVWHDPFDLRWNPAVEIYLAARNLLIQEAFTPDPNDSMAADVARLRETIVNAGKHFDYPSMELVCDAITDYLRGPEYYRHPVGERLLKQAIEKAEKLRPISEIDGAPEVINMWRVEETANDENIPAPPTPHPDMRLSRRVARRLRRLVLGLPSSKASAKRENHPVAEHKPKGGLAIIPVDGLCRPWRVLYDADRALAVEPSGRRGVMRVRDDRKRDEIMARFEALADQLVHDDSVAHRYHEERDSMTSFAFWKQYLDEAKR
ncbi:dTDP-rhamnosyl transferase RfbF [Bifidobacterium myosotis]|uniref:dTDP-rhamnosyl transferase RfbF n=1 Tax=Bifidobacterium myosotis TaxID=1630166 RepID=A0A261FHH8_9BIFI|nr:hypothetical protein EMO91_12345 [Bifidobacterium myosotis]OZG58592.1 dTDP-rhamnosyl transferase RfbF [Bifidobacterium myosotis]